MGAPRNSLGQFGKVRTPPPDLEFRCPECSLCGKETDTDGDSFVCYGCEAWWPMNGTGGKWNNPGELACAAVIEWWNTDKLGAEHESIRHLTEACILPDDHVGDHRAADPWIKWDDHDPRVLKRGTAA